MQSGPIRPSSCVSVVIPGAALAAPPHLPPALHCPLSPSTARLTAEHHARGGTPNKLPHGSLST